MTVCRGSRLRPSPAMMEGPEASELALVPLEQGDLEQPAPIPPGNAPAPAGGEFRPDSEFVGHALTDGAQFD